MRTEKTVYPANIQALITGAVKASQNKYGTITLTYSDGTTESAVCATDIEGFASWFSLVGFVQSGRYHKEG
jgi:hypothetical protein